MDQQSASSHNSAHHHPYYYHHNLLYPDDLQSSFEHPIYSHSQHSSFDPFPPRQMQQQHQSHPNPLLFQRPHSHPPQSPPSFPQHIQFIPQQPHHLQQPLQPQPQPQPQSQAQQQQPHQYEQLRHAHSQPSLSRLAMASYPHYDHPQSGPSTSTSRTTRSSPESFPDSSGLSTFRDEFQLHAAASVLAQTTGPSGELYAATSSVPRLPPIMQVERHQVTTTATQAASANRRRNEAVFRCPVPGCGSTFTRRFNLKGHLRSHTSERPFACEWPGCEKAFARQHDCKRHYQLHSAKVGAHVCQGCGKSFSRTDALNRHLRSDGGTECRVVHQKSPASRSHVTGSPQAGSPSPSDTTTDGTTASEKHARSRPPSI